MTGNSIMKCKASVNPELYYCVYRVGLSLLLACYHILTYSSFTPCYTYMLKLQEDSSSVLVGWVFPGEEHLVWSKYVATHMSMHGYSPLLFMS